MKIRFTRTQPAQPIQTAVLGDYIFAKEKLQKLQNFLQQQQATLEKAAKFRQRNEIAGKLPNGKRVILHRKYGTLYEDCVLDVLEIWDKGDILIAARVKFVSDHIAIKGYSDRIVVEKNGIVTATFFNESDLQNRNWKLIFGNRTKLRIEKDIAYILKQKILQP